MNISLFKLRFLVLLVAFTIISCSDDDEGTVVNDSGSAQLFASNNSDGNITIYDLVSGDVTTLATLSTAAEGIFFDDDTDEIIQASRSENQVDAYADISTFLSDISVSAAFSSSSDLSSPRDIAVNDDFVIVSDNSDADGNPDTPDGRFFIYTRDNGSLTLRNTVTTDFAVWGIEMVGDDLFAVVDFTNELALFTNFLVTNTTDATVSATKTIAIEGIVRTHGLAYDNGTMILTDVGSAADDADGAFHIITDFDSKFDSVADGETLLVAGNQTRIAGSGTAMGNPVAAEYDFASNTVFIAEALNGGGSVLSFTDADAGGNLSPTTSNTLSAASSLYFFSDL